MSLTHEPVTPFVTRRWGQGAPYNAEMPTDLTAPSRAVATGCMTTAMAMALSAFPDRIGTTKPIPDYSWDEVVNGTAYHQSYGGVYPSFEVDGDLPIADFAELAGVPEDSLTTDSATAGGWTIEKFGAFPRPGDTFVADGLTVKVLAMDADGLRVERILVRREAAAGS